MVQLIDPVPQLEEWIGRVYHLHGKDANIDWNKVKKYGVSVHHSLQFPERRDMAIQIGVRFSMCSIGTIFRVIFALRVSMMTFSTAIWK